MSSRQSRLLQRRSEGEMSACGGKGRGRGRGLKRRLRVGERIDRRDECVGEGGKEMGVE